MWDDDELRATVLAELDTAPPAVGGGLGEVVRRGKRRRRARHAGAALAVVALLTATGAVATALGGDPLPPTTSAPATTSVPPSEVSWPRADLPGKSPTGGDHAAPHATCDTPDVVHDRLDVHRASFEQQDKLQAALRTATSDTPRVATSRTGSSPSPDPDVEVPALGEKHLGPDRPEQREGWVYEVDVYGPSGTGSLLFEIGDYTGTPLAAADEQAFDVGNCEPPKRHVLADGTVLQLYDTRVSEPFESLTQTLRIFLPNGRMYQLVAQNWGSPDLRTNPDEPGSPIRVGKGRETLPLTEAQLAEIGLALLR